MSASTASAPNTAPPPATSAIGSSNGIDSQVSLPSISASRLLQRRTPGPGSPRLLGHGRRLFYDPLKQCRIDRFIACGRYRMAGFGQCAVTGIVERRALAAYLCDPAVEFT